MKKKYLILLLHEKGIFRFAGRHKPSVTILPIILGLSKICRCKRGMESIHFIRPLSDFLLFRNSLSLKQVQSSLYLTAYKTKVRCWFVYNQIKVNQTKLLLFYYRHLYNAPLKAHTMYFCNIRLNISLPLFHICVTHSLLATENPNLKSRMKFSL